MNIYSGAGLNVDSLPWANSFFPIIEYRILHHLTIIDFIKNRITFIYFLKKSIPVIMNVKFRMVIVVQSPGDEFEPLQCTKSLIISFPARSARPSQVPVVMVHNVVSDGSIQFKLIHNSRPDSAHSTRHNIEAKTTQSRMNTYKYTYARITVTEMIHPYQTVHTLILLYKYSFTHIHINLHNTYIHTHVSTYTHKSMHINVKTFVRTFSHNQLHL